MSFLTIWRRLGFGHLGLSGLLAAVALTLASVPVTAYAAETRQGEAVVVGPTETIDDDLYAFGGEVIIQGTINGDLVAFGGNQTISGAVAGDVIVAGGLITISGPVGGTIRVAGGDVTVSGPVDGDLIVGGGSVRVGPNARIGRDVLLGAGSATLDGRVGRNVLAGADDLTIRGAVEGNVRGDVGSLRLAERAVIGGSLSYASEQPASIASGATVRGSVEQREPRMARVVPSQGDRAAGAAIEWLRLTVGLVLLGLPFVQLFPGFSGRTVSTLGGSPAASFGLGVAVLLGVPFAAMLLFAAGLVFGGWWLSFVVMGVYGGALALSFAVVGSFVGSWILARTGRSGAPRAWGFTLGLVILTLASVVPVVGPLVSVVTMLFGLGALALASVRAWRAPTTGSAAAAGSVAERVQLQPASLPLTSSRA